LSETIVLDQLHVGFLHGTEHLPYLRLQIAWIHHRRCNTRLADVHGTNLSLSLEISFAKILLQSARGNKEGR
jgi:hypothetical protein